MEKIKKQRYLIVKEGKMIGSSHSIEGVGEFIGCTRAHIYKTIVNGFFTYKKTLYKIIDRLD